MRLDALPAQASWRHHAVRDAVEVAFAADTGDGHLLRGVTAGVEDGAAWAVTYDIDVDRRWGTRSARLRTRGRDGDSELLVERDHLDRWSIDGVHDLRLDGCTDVALEASVMTSALTLQRLHRVPRLPGEVLSVAATLVRLDRSVVRLDQTFEVTSSAPGGHRVAYTAGRFDAALTIDVDRSGLVTDHPGVAVRVS